MNFKVLKKDLKKKKSINIIIVIFVFMATLFISSSVNYLIVSVKGIDDFVKAAELPDYLIFSIGQMKAEISDVDKRGIEFLEKEKEKGVIESFSFDMGVYASADNFETVDGNSIDIKNVACLFNTPDIKQSVLFDMDDKKITEVEDGYVYVNHKAIVESDKINIGDKIVYKNNKGFRKEFIVKGGLKDAVFGSDMMGNYRFVISEKDLKEILDSEGAAYAGIIGVKTNDVDKLTADLNKSSVAYVFSADRGLIKTTYIMDMIVGVLLLLISLLLVIISVFILRFTIIFTINEAGKEIGIMKAIGIKDRRIRSLYISKYALLSFVGAIFGFVLSIYVSNALLKSIMQNIVIKNKNTNILIMLATTVLMLLIIIFSAFRSTKKVKKMKPLDAIRKGFDNNKGVKKGFLRLRNKKSSVTSFLALNDILKGLRKFIIPIFTTIVGIWLIIMPTNTINTLDSDRIVPVFAIQNSDIIVSDNEYFLNLAYYKNKDFVMEGMKKVEDALSKNGIKVERSFMEIIYRLNIRKGEKLYNSMSFQGINTHTDEYTYLKGTAPKYKNEVAITRMIADKLDAKIGDTVYIYTGVEEKPYIITGIFQSFSNMGEGIRFHEDEDISMDFYSSAFGYQMNLEGDVSIDEVRDILKKELPYNTEVKSIKGFVRDQIGGVIEKLAAYKIMVIIIVILISVMVIVLMQRTFLIREESEIATLKSVGINNKKLVVWQTKRMAMVIIIGTIIGILSSGLFTRITSGQLFKMMGAYSIKFVINPWEIYIIYPIALVVSCIIACMMASRRVRKVDIRNMNVD